MICFPHPSSFYRPSRCSIGHFPSTIVINFQLFPLFYTIHRVLLTCLLYNSCISMQRNAFYFWKFPSHTSVAVAGSMLNDRLIPIAASYRAVVAVVERGGLIWSSDNPSTSFSRKNSKYGGLSWWSHRKPQCIKHILEFYNGKGKGVATARSNNPIHLIQIQCKVMRMHFIKVLQFVWDPIKCLLQSIWKTNRWRDKIKHRSHSCNVQRKLFFMLNARRAFKSVPNRTNSWYSRNWKHGLLPVL